MNIDASLFNKEDDSRLTVTHSKKSEPLRQCVSDAMQRYFQNLNGHGANNLYRLVMNEVEAPLLESVMKHTGGNQTLAASILGISRSTLRKKLSQYDLD
ncbi:MAG: DNA-binding transcriptional regulator Fis [Candidatus Thiodiazotropha sp. (ex Semelilucina semeliformis)]|nr:DNA-binding transcriptional regulator Fis [Candidatus Thiodiazotropha sp. (ex Myrtea spinifera)]MCU7806340.1 DNA-binding transcriptional regulator Fis [Candidatus Thiodiazotropha sp. (ex Semelilucina semeliformis)]MCU7828363.1 DNA-binding transcriptional regulator Fis [Candidatus Thiodiazotropha sp. (ex Myrtea sp. 'scaly one' KF741663)]MCU7852246.1 DNA-binding transcriptional regulator Fis [Candidatus Thiodiazotropha sp. (ex Monitilora ramsayi)]MCU7914379.1 DNA-binding transcriptional regula